MLPDSRPSLSWWNPTSVINFIIKYSNSVGLLDHCSNPLSRPSKLLDYGWNLFCHNQTLIKSCNNIIPWFMIAAWKCLARRTIKSQGIMYYNIWRNLSWIFSERDLAVTWYWYRSRGTVFDNTCPIIGFMKAYFLVRFGHGSFDAAMPLQHREAQPQPTMHSCYFRSSNESLYQSQLGGLNCLRQTGFQHPVFGVGSERQYHYTTQQFVG